MRRALVAVLALAGCGLPAGVRTPEDAKPLTVHAVDWNPAHADVGRPTDVVDLDGDVVVASSTGASVLLGGVLTERDPRASGLHALTTMTAPDAASRWIAGVDDHGAVVRLRARKVFEPVSRRFGLEGAKVSSIGDAGGRLVAFALEDGRIAIGDGADVVRLEGAPKISGALVAGGNTVAGLSSRGAWKLDLRTRTSTSFELEGARFLAVDDRGKVIVATTAALYAERDDGSLALRYVSPSGSLHGLAASAGVVWFADGGELGTLGSDVAVSRGAGIPASARLEASSSGDVWTLDERRGLARWSAGGVAPTEVAWASTAGAVYARVCASCHAEGGSSGVDLSSEAAWTAKRSAVKSRVLDKRDMPPRDTSFTDADRTAIARWLGPSP